MFSAAVNPLVWSGLALVSVPIIIHLINRLRYKRIRWAAMEFLLKSQQRNRRKLILEQLLLLFLRCLLVACVVALIARPTWFLGSEGRGTDWPTHHVILLDDTLSTRDLVDAQAPEGATAFRTGTKLLADLAQHQVEGGGGHYWTLLRMTEPRLPEVGKAVPAEVAGAPGSEPLGQLLVAAELSTLKDRLDGLRPSYLPALPLPSLQQAALHLARVKEGHRVLHVVSDFRGVDWLNSQADPAVELLADLARQKVRVRLHDVARPARGPSVTETPPGHGNLGLVDVRVQSRRRAEPTAAAATAEQPLRVVTPRLPFDVAVQVKNFGLAERRQVRLTVSVDGVEKASRQIDRLPGGGEQNVAFNLELGPEEAPGLKAITARLEDPEQQDFLPTDNARHAFVELRKEIAVLLVDGNLRGEPPSDGFFLSAALTATQRTGVKVERLGPRELAKRGDLSAYSVVYLVDVAGVGKSEAALEPEGLAALETYVRGGGSLFISVGPRANVVSFTDQLYRQGEGVFPVPLMTRPDPEGRSTLPFIDDAPDERDVSPKVRFPDEGHPVLPFEGDLVDLLSRYLLVNRYFRVPPAWQAPAGTKVLLRLTNRRPLALYVDEGKALADGLAAVSGPLGPRLREAAGRVRAILAEAESLKNQKGPLLEVLASLRGDTALAETWSQQPELRQRLDKYFDRLTEGDPLLVESRYGAGHVLALLTPAAPTPIRGKEYGWNTLATGDLGEFFFVPFVLSTQSYLGAVSSAAGDRDFSRLVGEAYPLVLPKQRYQPEVEVWYQPDDRAAPQRVNVLTAEAATLPGLTGPRSQVWRASLTAAKGPGLYRIRLNQPRSDGAPPVEGQISLDPAQATSQAAPEERPLIFNVDNRAEGSLGRFAEADLREKLAAALNVGPAKLAQSEALAFVAERGWFSLNPLDDGPREVVRSSSWSDYSWVLFAFLALLLLEQTLARWFSHLT